MRTDPMEQTRYADELTPAELRELEERQMEQDFKAMDEERKRIEADAALVHECRRVLRTFYETRISIASVQPVLDLATKLNPSLLDSVTHPF